MILILLLSVSTWKFFQVFFFAGLMFLFILIYVKFRKSQPQIYIRNLPSPVPPRNYEGLPDEDRDEAKFFWEFLDLFKNDFEKRGHPLQYRQLIDLLKFGPIQDLKDFSAESLVNSKHLHKYTSDSELREEVYDIVLENLKEMDFDNISAQKQINLMVYLNLTEDEVQKIIRIIEQNSRIYHGNVRDVIIKLNEKLK